jgi:Inosine-uridine nucleoside N-ribohydrolase
LVIGKYITYLNICIVLQTDRKLLLPNSLLIIVCFQSWRTDILGNLRSPAVQLLNKAERYQLQEPLDTWVCADCVTAGIIVDPTFIVDYTIQYGYVDYEGDLPSGSLFVDYMNNTDMPANLMIVKTIDIDRYQQLLLTGIGGNKQI